MTKRILVFTLLFSLIGFISCQKDKKPDTKITIQESKDNLNTLTTDMQQDINAVYDESGWQAANTFVTLMSIDDPVFGGNFLKKSASEKLTLKQLLNLKNLKGIKDQIIFADYAGTYTPGFVLSGVI